MSSHNFHTSLPFCGSPVHCVVCLAMQSQQPLTTNLIMSEKESDSPIVQLSDEGLLLRILTSHTTFICIHNLRTTCKTIRRLLSPRQCHAARAGGRIFDSALFLISSPRSVPGAQTSSNDEVRHQHTLFQWHVLHNGKWRDAPWSKERHCQVAIDDSICLSICANSDHVLFMQRNEDHRSHFLFRIQTGEKFILPDHPEAAYCAICNFDDCLVLVGPHKIFMSSQAIDRWERLSDVPNRVRCVAAGIIGQKLCVLGLTYLADDGYPVGCLQLYDFDTKTWDMGPRMPERLNRVSGAVVQGEFHVVGRKPGVRPDRIVCLSFNPKSMAWKCTAPAECVPGRGLLTCHAVSHRGSLWILHEDRDSMNFWKKLEKDGSWTKCSSEAVPLIPAHVVGCIRTVGSVVFTVKE